MASNFSSSSEPAEEERLLGEVAREYARDDATPGWEALEEIVGALERGSGVAFASGMAAAAAVLDLLPVGSRVVAPTDSYSGVRALLADGTAKGRWRTELVDITDTDTVIAATTDAAMLWLESPTNPLMDVADLPALGAGARATNTLAVVDNTFATPLLQRPLALGPHVVIHSATKFIGGHSDLLSGLAVTADRDTAALLRRHRQLTGATPGGLEIFLALRGIRTMALRIEHGQRSAGELAQRLQAHPAVTRVRYPGLRDDPGHRQASTQMGGFGAILAFELDGAEPAQAVCETVRIIHAATSVGGVESTIERRAKLPGQAHVPPGLVGSASGANTSMTSGTTSTPLSTTAVARRIGRTHGGPVAPRADDGNADHERTGA